jgi:phosphate transport system substrate-binding protein
MAPKNDTTILVLALLITLGLAGGGFWWFTRPQNQGSDPKGNDANSQTTSSQPLNRNSPNPNSAQPVKSFAQVQNVPSALVSYGGSTTWAPIRREVDALIEVVWPDFKLRYTQHPTKPPGSGTGISMLLNDELAFAQSSRSIKDTEYQQAQQKGFTLKQIPVAIDGIAVAVNPNLDISGLTVAQLKEIYTGKITNWQELGGPNLPIVAYSRRPEDSGTIEFFVESVLNGDRFAESVVFIPTTTEALRQVSNDLGAIYYASAPEIVRQCKIKSLPIAREVGHFVAPYQEPLVPQENCPAQRNQLNQAAFQSGEYPLTRRLFVIVKQNGQIDQQAGEAYSELMLTDQGQDLIRKAGFVSIR